MKSVILACLTLCMVTGCATETESPAPTVTSHPQGLTDRFEGEVGALDVEIHPGVSGPVVRLAYTDARVTTGVELLGEAADEAAFAEFIATVDPAFLAAVRDELATRAAPADEAAEALHDVELAVLFYEPGALGTAESALRVGGAIAGGGATRIGGGRGNGFWCEVGCNAAYALCVTACTGTGPAAVACILLCTTLYTACDDGC